MVTHVKSAYLVIDTYSNYSIAYGARDRGSIPLLSIRYLGLQISQVVRRLSPVIVNLSSILKSVLR